MSKQYKCGNCKTKYTPDSEQVLLVEKYNLPEYSLLCNNCQLVKDSHSNTKIILRGDCKHCITCLENCPGGHNLQFAPNCSQFKM